MNQKDSETLKLLDWLLNDDELEHFIDCLAEGEKKEFLVQMLKRRQKKAPSA